MGTLSAFLGDGKWIATIAKMIVAERECYLFLTFEFVAQPRLGPAIVRVTGPAGSKDFLKTACVSPTRLSSRGRQLGSREDVGRSIAAVTSR